MSFYKFVNNFSIQKYLKLTKYNHNFDISQILKKNKINFTDFCLLLSPMSTTHIEKIAQKAHLLTKQRFGRGMELYVPIYLANHCINQCIYCGFQVNNIQTRTKLTLDEIRYEGKILANKGFKHILLLTGEAPNIAGIDYLIDAINALKNNFASIGLEVYPMDSEDYKKLVKAGANSLTIYQETYDPELYDELHISGPKKNYLYRLETPERAAQAGFHQINIGALLGLADFRYEAIMLFLHLTYLQKYFWNVHYSISVPRIQDMGSGFQARFPVSDLELTKMILAFRLAFPELGITLSTREPEKIRNNLLNLGITRISAESKTAPGAYSGKKSVAQFSVHDERSLKEILSYLKKKGFDPILKDWDKSFRLV